MSDDSDANDTQVLQRKDTPFENEGTEEIDRSALLARLQGDQHSPKEPTRDSGEVVAPGLRDTEQHGTIPERTRSDTPTLAAKFQPTQHYTVPDTLLEQSRSVEDQATTTFSTESLLEFEAVIDEYGRIALPDSALRGRFRRGARVRIVAHVLDD